VLDLDRYGTFRTVDGSDAIVSTQIGDRICPVSWTNDDKSTNSSSRTENETC